MTIYVIRTAHGDVGRFTSMTEATLAALQFVPAPWSVELV